MTTISLSDRWRLPGARPLGLDSYMDGGRSAFQLESNSIKMCSRQAQVGDILSLDTSYLASLFHPVAAWGKHKPHQLVSPLFYSDPFLAQLNHTTSSSSGIFALARNIKRPIPKCPNDVTRETVHASVLEQEDLNPHLVDTLAKHPELIMPLLPLEEEIKLNWPLHMDAQVIHAANGHSPKPKSSAANNTEIGSPEVDINSVLNGARRISAYESSRTRTA
ncbi:hypothetical protein DXG03_006980 [Asterophora parasitica]|uniref:Uncharacterized protein n=1 Tax=Asterophora parasitica TaxID=117018 RepID=A0A9P7GDN1_9AGAR|nr:hypothetical protein DXG03_006980 [Asterophora parasitica]